MDAMLATGCGEREIPNIFLTRVVRKGLSRVKAVNVGEFVVS